MNTCRIIVSGATGQLGAEIKELAAAFAGSEFRFLSREQFDIRDTTSMLKVIDEFRPTHFINCAAYTAVDKAESEADLAFAVNASAVELIAVACAATNVRLLHISTDYVFDGTSSSPYREEDPTCPINVYGHSKLLGEQLCIKSNPASMVIRTSWLYSSHGHNFVKTILRLLGEKDSIRVVNDQVGSPTWARDVAEAILKIVHHENWRPGVFHYCGEGQVSWFGFALEIARQINSSCSIHPIPSVDFPTPARRPAFSLLETSKIRSTFGVRTSPWKESLYHCLHQLQSSS